MEDSFAQIVKGNPSGSKILKPIEVFEVGLKLKKNTNIQYNFNADAILLFDIHSHDGNQIITHSATESKTFEGTFVAPKDGDYYFLAMNLRGTDVPLQYSISLEQDIHYIQYEETQYDIAIFSNSTVEIVGFSQENKQMIIRVNTPYLTPGFISVTIPKVLLDGPFDFQGGITEYTESQDDSTSTFIINTPIGTHDITITGTTAVPEVPIPMLFLIMATISFLIITKFKLKNQF